MNFGIVGNNDGPLYLLKGLDDSTYKPLFVGLQKAVTADLRASYKNNLSGADLFEGFEESKLIEHLESYNIDLLINCFCNFRFRKLLQLPFPILNIHLSPLPAYRGRHPVQWALINGEKEFGFSVHKMTEKFDAGEIYWRKNVPVAAGMSVKELRSRLMQKLQDGFASFLKAYDREDLSPLPNSDDEATHISRRKPQDSRLTEWNDSQLIFRKVQALRSESYPAYIDTGKLHVKCIGASLGATIVHDLSRPFIHGIKSDKFQIVCLDGQTIWLKCLPERLKYLSLGQKLD